MNMVTVMRAYDIPQYSFASRPRSPARMWLVAVRNWLLADY